MNLKHFGYHIQGFKYWLDILFNEQPEETVAYKTVPKQKFKKLLQWEKELNRRQVFPSLIYPT